MDEEDKIEMVKNKKLKKKQKPVRSNISMENLDQLALGYNRTCLEKPIDKKFIENGDRGSSN